ncbi:MAG: twin-arginine translocase subunit TatC [Kiritimatiellae bacterium]|nr:twin-arginine translocase subunit TatC [Kiritimatiellia bacterium]MBR4604208.1 twin-arginine translocase subunit TatC [Kiritimatiellia bacterium]
MKDAEMRNDPPMTLLAHLAAVRDMLVFSLASWVGGAVVAIVFSPQILSWLKSPAAAERELLQGLDLTSGFSTMMSIALWGGIAIAFPLVSYAVLRFVSPALTKREKVSILCILVSGGALFLAGAWLCYARTLPLVVEAFQSINRWLGLSVETIRIEGYIAIVLRTVVAFGLVFQLPLALFVMGMFGLVSSEALRGKRRLAIVLAFFLAMFLTPPDPISQLVMAIPLCLLYELSIWAVWLRERSRGGREQ